ncbi:serine protease [Sphingomonas sp. BK580]|uniref:trypsin-like serine peptidase n=1 Tax=Sphingomonas sp. BK580 TaxID=2586972 RepID=UPI00161B43D9|nr:hypothetical protein [Sphingomonas sp. BK580]MBB3693532.1 hypothetical protein [Sphingomonas sp. BK580]
MLIALLLVAAPGMGNVIKTPHPSAKELAAVPFYVRDEFKRIYPDILRSRRKADDELNPIISQSDAWVVDERNDRQIYEALTFHFPAPSPLEEVDRFTQAMSAPVGEFATEVRKPDGSSELFVGSGYMISRCIAVTSGHVLPDPSTRTYQTGEIALGEWKFRIGSSPRFAFQGNTTGSVFDGFAGRSAGSERTHDFAFVRLRSCVGDRYGWFDPIDWDDIEYDHVYKAMKLGFPGNRARGVMVKQGCYALAVWLGRGDYQRPILVDGCSSIHGMSGGPLLILVNGEWRAIGITSGRNAVGFARSTMTLSWSNSIDAPLFAGRIREPRDGKASNPLPSMIREGRTIAPGWEAAATEDTSPKR